MCNGTARQSSRLIAVSAIVLLRALAFGEAAPDSLTVDEAVRAALANNLSIRSAVVECRIKERASEFSFDSFLPRLSVYASIFELNQTIPVLEAVLPSGYNWYFVPERPNLSLGFCIQEIFSPSYPASMGEAALEYRESLLSRVQAEKSVTVSVKKSFYQLLVQDEAIAVTRSRLETAQERLCQAELSYRLGRSPELDCVYAKLNVENLIPELRALETARLAAMSRFQELLGFDPKPDMKLAGSLEGNAISIEGATLSEYDRFDVRQALQGEKLLENAFKRKELTLLPNLILQYSADPTINGPERNSPWNGSNWSQTEDLNGALSLTLYWNLDGFLPGSEYRVGKGEIEDRIALARETAARTLTEARDDAIDQERAIRDCKERIGNLTNAVEASKRAYELTDLAYKVGTGLILDLEEAEVSWHGARIRLLEERLKLLSLICDFEAKYEGEP